MEVLPVRRMPPKEREETSAKPELFDHSHWIIDSRCIIKYSGSNIFMCAFNYIGNWGVWTGDPPRRQTPFAVVLYSFSLLPFAEIQPRHKHCFHHTRSLLFSCRSQNMGTTLKATFLATRRGVQWLIKMYIGKTEWRKPWETIFFGPGSMAMSLQLAGSWNSKFCLFCYLCQNLAQAPYRQKPTTMKCLEKVLVFAEVQAFYPVRQAGKIWPPQNTAVSGRHLQIVAPLLQKAASRPNISSRTARSPNSSGEIFLPSSAMAKIRLPGPAKFCQHYRSMLNKLPENSLDLHLWPQNGALPLSMRLGWAFPDFQQIPGINDGCLLRDRSPDTRQEWKIPRQVCQNDYKLWQESPYTLRDLREYQNSQFCSHQDARIFSARGVALQECSLPARSRSRAGAWIRHHECKKNYIIFPRKNGRFGTIIQKDDFAERTAFFRRIKRLNGEWPPLTIWSEPLQEADRHVQATRGQGLLLCLHSASFQIPLRLLVFLHFLKNAGKTAWTHPKIITQIHFRRNFLRFPAASFGHNFKNFFRFPNQPARAQSLPPGVTVIRRTLVPFPDAISFQRQFCQNREDRGQTVLRRPFSSHLFHGADDRKESKCFPEWFPPSSRKVFRPDQAQGKISVWSLFHMARAHSFHATAFSSRSTINRQISSWLSG